MASSSVVSANSQFSIDLYRTLIAGDQQEKNVFFSPFSITAALAMVSVGAHGGTKDEILSGLRLGNQSGNNVEQINSEFKQLFQTLDVQTETDQSSGSSFPFGNSDRWARRQEPPRLELANRVFLQQGLQVKKPFADTLESSYKSTFGEVDIAGNPSDAEQMINKWVSKVTHDKINDLINDLSADSRLVLVSAIYFKAGWQNEFDRGSTKEQDFFPAAGKTTKAKFMSYFSHATFSYAQFPDMKASAIGIPYIGSSFRMVIILPNERNGLGTLQKSLKPAVFDVSRYSTFFDIDVSIPKFKVEANYHLPQFLGTLGMKQPFMETADFTGIADSPPLLISDVVHKSFISIDENGTEAAAATAVIMAEAMSMTFPVLTPPRVVFNANHPFLFAVQHVPSKTILFFGDLQVPNSD